MRFLETIIEYAPFYIIVLYIISILSLFIVKRFRSNFMDAHKEKSTYSWTRFLSTFVVISAVVVVLAQVAGSREVNIALVTTMLVTAFGGKVVQKNIESGTFSRKDKEQK